MTSTHEVLITSGPQQHLHTNYVRAQSGGTVLLTEAFHLPDFQRAVCLKDITTLDATKITLHFITLCYVTLSYITLHYITLNCVILQFAILKFYNNY